MSTKLGNAQIVQFEFFNVKYQHVFTVRPQMCFDVSIPSSKLRRRCPGTSEPWKTPCRQRISPRFSLQKPTGCGGLNIGQIACDPEPKKGVFLVVHLLVRLVNHDMIHSVSEKCALGTVMRQQQGERKREREREIEPEKERER